MAIGSVGGTSPMPVFQRAGSAASALTPEQQQEVNRLKAIDRKVRAHEQAHMAAGGGLAGGASFQFVRGPDGRQYAVAGEVSISLSSGQTPESTIARARQIQAAALAPIDPSSQDRAVAAAAAQMESQARAELSRMKQAELADASSGDSAASGRAASANALARGLSAYAAQEDVPPPNPGRIDQYA